MANQGLPQRLIAVGRFNEDLRFTSGERMFLQRVYALVSRCRVLRQVAHKRKLLTIQTAG